MSSARRASNPDCHNRERVLSPRGVQRSNQLSYGTGPSMISFCVFIEFLKSSPNFSLIQALINPVGGGPPGHLPRGGGGAFFAPLPYLRNYWTDP